MTRKTVKWSETSTFKIPVVMPGSINEFVFIWSINIALFLDIFIGVVTAGIKLCLNNGKFDNLKGLN